MAGTLPGAPTLDDPTLVACPSSPDHRRVAVHFGDSLVFKFDRFLGEGTSPELEIGRAPMTLGKAAKPAEQVTISIDQGATPKLRIEWGTVSASTTFKVGS